MCNFEVNIESKLLNGEMILDVIIREVLKLGKIQRIQGEYRSTPASDVI